MQGWPSLVKVEEFQGIGCRKGDACLAYNYCHVRNLLKLKKPLGKSHKTGLHNLFKIQNIRINGKVAEVSNTFLNFDNSTHLKSSGYGVTFRLSMMLITFRNSKERGFDPHPCQYIFAC